MQQTGFPYQWTTFQPAKNPTEFNNGAPLGQGKSGKSKHLRRLMPPLFHQGALILGPAGQSILMFHGTRD